MQNGLTFRTGLIGKPARIRLLRTMSYAYIAWAGNLALLTVILVRGFRGDLIRRYPTFYFYAAVSLVMGGALVPISLLYGYTSRLYYYAYYVPSLLFPVIQLWVLRDLYGRIIGNDKTASGAHNRVIILLAVLTAPVALDVLVLRHTDYFVRYHLWTLSLQVAACVFVYRALLSRPDINPGRNISGMLAGLSLMAALQSVNFVRFLFGEATYEIFAFFVPFIYSIALITFSYTLWSYEPMEERPLVNLAPALVDERLQRVNEQLQRAVRSLVLPR